MKSLCLECIETCLENLMLQLEYAFPEVKQVTKTLIPYGFMSLDSLQRQVQVNETDESIEIQFTACELVLDSSHDKIVQVIYVTKASNSHVTLLIKDKQGKELVNLSKELDNFRLGRVMYLTLVQIAETLAELETKTT